MTDFIKDLIETIKDNYAAAQNKQDVAELLERCKASKSYNDAYEYAKKAGFNLETAIKENWNADGELFFGSMADLLEGVAGQLHDDVDAACALVQANKNLARGIRVKPQTAPVNMQNFRSLANKMVGKQMSDLNGEIATEACKMVDDIQQENMRFQNSLGYDVIVTRVYDGVGLRAGSGYEEDCGYCLSKAGTNTFTRIRDASKSGMFGRHEGCGCIIDYECKSTGTKSKNLQNYNTGASKKKKLDGDKKNVVENLEKNPIDYMSNSFKPKYGEVITDITIDSVKLETGIKKVTNSSFDLWAQEDASKRDMAVKYVEKHLKQVKKDVKDVEIPSVRIIDFKRNNINSNAIAGYRKGENILYWNSAYTNEKSVKEFLEKIPNLFASTDVNSPFKHELGHKFYEDTVKSIAKNSNLSYIDAKNSIDYKLLEYIQEHQEASDWLRQNVSIYASNGYLDNRLTEVVAEALASEDEKKISKDIMNIMRGGK